MPSFNLFLHYIVGEEDAWERRIREGRVRKGKPAMTNSARKEMEVENLYVPKARRRMFQMDYSSQVVDPT